MRRFSDAFLAALASACSERSRAEVAPSSAASRSRGCSCPRSCAYEICQKPENIVHTTTEMVQPHFVPIGERYRGGGKAQMPQRRAHFLISSGTEEIFIRTRHRRVESRVHEVLRRRRSNDSKVFLEARSLHAGFHRLQQLQAAQDRHEESIEFCAQCSRNESKPASPTWHSSHVTGAEAIAWPDLLSPTNCGTPLGS